MTFHGRHLVGRIWLLCKRKSSDGKVQKRTEQTRYMLMSLQEAHQKFKEEHPGDEIGLSKFCESRPVNVKCFDHLPHQVCLCPYNENIRLLLVALRDHIPLTASFAGQVTCNGETKQCLVGECDSSFVQVTQVFPFNTSNGRMLRDQRRYRDGQHNRRCLW